MTKIVSVFGSFYKFWRSLIEPIARATGRRVTANTITVTRTFGAPFTILFVLLGWPRLGFGMFLISALADGFDGAVATARVKLGFTDDQKLGAFLDAFCDKMFFIMLLIGVLPLGDYEEVPVVLKTIFYAVCGGLLIIETILAGIRMSDYQHERRMNGTDHKERLLKSTLVGKLKFLLQMIGAGGLIFAQPKLDHWAFYVGLTCFALSLPFALESLIQKLQARRAY